MVLEEMRKTQNKQESVQSRCKSVYHFWIRKMPLTQMNTNSSLCGYLISVCLTYLTDISTTKLKLKSYSQQLTTCLKASASNLLHFLGLYLCQMNNYKGVAYTV